jgi:serine/threonine protein kinase
VVGPATLSGQLKQPPPPPRDRYVDLRLGNGWTARVAVGDGRLENRPGAHGMVPTKAQWLTWLSDPLQWIQEARRQDVMKTSATTTVCRVRLPLDNGRQIEAVCKHRRSRHLRKRLLNLFRVSRPTRTWRRAQTLLNYHIPTARPLAVVEKRRFGLLLDSLLITEFLRDAVDLESLLTAQMRGLDNLQAHRIKSQVSEALAAFLLRLRSAGLYHRDLKALNIIVQWNRQSAEPPRICLVDLDGVKRFWSSRNRGWMSMLMRLNVSVDPFRRVNLTDRLRLLKQYIRRSGTSIPWKDLWRELAVMSERKRQIQTRHQERDFRKYGRF